MKTLIISILLWEQPRGQPTWSARTTWCPRAPCWWSLVYSLSQWRNEVRWRSGQEASFAPPCLNLPNQPDFEPAKTPRLNLPNQVWRPRVWTWFWTCQTPMFEPAKPSLAPPCLNLASPCLNLRSFGSKCTVLKKVVVTLLGVFSASRSDSVPGELCPSFPPSLRPWSEVCLAFLRPQCVSLFKQIPTLWRVLLFERRS